jgi:hypothetical protein
LWFPPRCWPDRHGATDDGAGHVTAGNGDFRCDRALADIGRGAICVGPRSVRSAARSASARPSAECLSGAIDRGRDCHQPGRESRPCGRRRGIAGADANDFASAGGLLRYVFPAPRAGGQRRQLLIRACHDQARQRQDDAGLRAGCQRADRSRQAASARPLPELRVSVAIARSQGVARMRARSQALSCCCMDCFAYARNDG